MTKLKHYLLLEAKIIQGKALEDRIEKIADNIYQLPTCRHKLSQPIMIAALAAVPGKNSFQICSLVDSNRWRAGTI
ncbi:MAG: hypothetical protein WD688_07965 [Candidatus Binatia bacterium]